MADDETANGEPLGHRLHGDPVEPEAADAPVVPPGARDGIGRSGDGDRGMEGRVEDRDVRHGGESTACRLERAKRGRVVQRGEGRQLGDGRGDAVVDHDRLAEPRPSVDDAMPDRRDPPGRSSSEPRRSTTPCASRTSSLRLVDPALTTRTLLRTARSSPARRDGPRRGRGSRPGPRVAGRPSPAGGARPWRRGRARGR